MQIIQKRRYPLSRYERDQIEYYLRLKQGIRCIGRRLKRNHSIISKEVNNHKDRDGVYRAESAQRKADHKAKKTNKRKLESSWVLHQYVTDKLREHWSPEQIAGRLKEHNDLLEKEYPGISKYSISHESIYQYIHEGEGKHEYLWPHLRRHKGPKRQKRKARKPNKTSIPERVSIHARPEEVQLKQTIGHWESDTLEGTRKKKQAVSVQYERRSQYAKLHKIQNKTAKETEDALRSSIESTSPKLFNTITFDNGPEGAGHTSIRDDYQIQTYFCDAFASWQKGGVENLNGLIREFFPKKTDFSVIPDEEVRHVEKLLNTRPRKSLKYATPEETINQYLD